MSKLYIVEVKKDGQVLMHHEESNPVKVAKDLEFIIDMCGKEQVFLTERQIINTPRNPQVFIDFINMQEVVNERFK